MNALNKKLLVLGMLTSMMIGCASTDPYTAQSNDDFVYDSNMSFAMNVVDGSLGFHNGLRDTDAPKNSDTTPGTLDYAADGIIGAAFGGGLGGGLLSMLGTNTADAPLNRVYGIAYMPISDTSKSEINRVFEKVDLDIKNTILNNFELSFLKTKVNKTNNYKYFYFKGEPCSTYLKAIGDKSNDDECVFGGYAEKQLLNISTSTPDGKKGLFAVIGLSKMSTGQFYDFYSSTEYYTFYPKGFESTFPFVTHNGKAYLFIKPSNQVESFMSINNLRKVNFKVDNYF
ncbi:MULTISPECIES: hypothetical protein [unclassified Shewanella]|uniref:hypothetical protein n=1 Tax=Shewanella TaxID=22 RepID=UPI000CC26DF3|nr:MULTISPECIES: hypothetical protein [unclassified Shewanella]MBB1390087.1 hypothetical protein [Shewanella sp. SG44-6]PIX69770.1 MAG: hypothetical protein COZ42_17450 [Shewanella sp. CG_4_10_14_3_um_filter_42_91]PIY64916.1 MAG: hypothetical protein COY92_14640 [Shewanella sp. CG_4_10_14_0_8_um_filter_42_13]